MITFQKLIFKLYKYWSNIGCNIVQSWDIEIGAATFHPITFFNSLIKKNSFFSYLQLCRRPNDSSYCKNNNKLQQYYQFQVIIKPDINNIQNIYIDSLKYLGINLNLCDLRFIEDDWENPTLGAYGVGWEVWLNGIEITQFTYFQKMAGFDCIPSMVEITYGLERISLYLQNIDKINNLIWNENKYLLKYNTLFFNNELEKSLYNLNNLNIKFLELCMNNYKNESLRLINLNNPLIILSYEFAVKMVYYFNILDSKKCFSSIERQRNILCIRSIFNKIASIYLSKL